MCIDRQSDIQIDRHTGAIDVIVRDRGVGGGGAGGDRGARAPQHFKNYKELVRKRVLCPPPPNIQSCPPPNLKVAPRSLIVAILHD